MVELAARVPSAGEQSQKSFRHGRPSGRLLDTVRIAREQVMKLPRRRFLRLAAGAAALPAVSRIAWSQAYPARPITIVVPYPAGGPTDTIVRVVVDGMRTLLDQTVIVENVAGANGSIGVGRVARAAADGYTIGAGEWGSHVASGAIYALKYDVLKDLKPVSLISSSPHAGR
jgi:tripartite-type tricarboxylate transporter receptor subunit TctC